MGLTSITGVTWSSIVLLCTIYIFSLLNVNRACAHTVSGTNTAFSLWPVLKGFVLKLCFLVV